MPLFEVAIMEVPSSKEKEDGATEKLVFGPKFVVATDSQSAAIKSILENASAMSDVNKEKMQVLVRPFA